MHSIRQLKLSGQAISLGHASMSPQVNTQTLPSWQVAPAAEQASSQLGEAPVSPDTGD